jgi:TonB family protein
MLGVTDEGLGDLRVLVDGFLQLIETAAEQPPEQPVVVPAAIAPASAAAIDPAPAAPKTPARPRAAAATGPRIYTAGNPGVSPPVVIDQRMPAISAGMGLLVKAAHKSGRTGMVDVVVDELGEVAEVVVRESLHSSLDQMITRAARRWKYQPAMKDGVPVRFLKTITLVAP